MKDQEKTFSVASILSVLGMLIALILEQLPYGVLLDIDIGNGEMVPTSMSYYSVEALKNGFPWALITMSLTIVTLAFMLARTIFRKWWLKLICYILCLTTIVFSSVVIAKMAQNGVTTVTSILVVTFQGFAMLVDVLQGFYEDYISNARSRSKDNENL